MNNNHRTLEVQFPVQEDGKRWLSVQGPSISSHEDDWGVDATEAQASVATIWAAMEAARALSEDPEMKGALAPFKDILEGGAPVLSDSKAWRYNADVREFDKKYKPRIQKFFEACGWVCSIY